MKEKVQAPQLRFDGFTDDWEERKLAEFTTSFSGGTPSAGNSSYYKGDIPFIRSGEINSDKTELFLTEDGLKNSSAKMVSVGDILYALYGATSGEVGISQINGAINQAILAIKPCDGYNSHFLMQWLKLQKQRIIDKYLQGGQGNLSGSIVKNLVLNVPNFEEQKKIGTFFKQLDDTITLHQRKLDLLKEQKKGYLQKMFPKNGSKIPELRFEGFTDDWEQRKLGDEVRIVMGQSPNSENYTDDPNDYILVQGNADMKNGRVLPRVWTTQVTKQAEKDDLILSVRAPVGDIGKTAYDVVIGRGVAAIKGNEFIFQNLGKMKSDGYWTRYSTGSTFESINSTDIKEAIISVPAIEEQDKIGSFFKQLDNTIALHQLKLDLLKEQKKGFLQKMFA
ncbi:restriction endonuclease subunit S [Lactococcus lactis]|uniref:restriction endonuclease subunit S n=1 Tax=Lactococcus lactis TaxID=1358 RepID=UPI00288E88E6|nr:restriction endonuclease subunit S [Lactococcus lactis]MDT2900360.1 restriction endonuclease subunit S [Lactococcus lactis]